MKRFKLQSVLDYRKSLADKAYQSLMACMEERTAVAAAKKHAETEMARLCRELETVKAKAECPADMLLYEHCIWSRSKEIEALKAQLAKADARVEEKRSELVKARQKKKVLEILKQKREDAEREMEKRREGRLIDEIAVFNFGGGR